MKRLKEFEMAQYYRDPDGELTRIILMETDEAGDEFFERDSVTIVDGNTVMDYLLAVIANSGSNPLKAYVFVMDHILPDEYGDYEFDGFSDEEYNIILSYVNEIRVDTVAAGDENDFYFSEEEFTLDDIGF